MKSIKRLICVLIVVALCAGGVGCRKDPNAVTIDTTKTQLYIGCLSAGLNTDWLRAAADDFEEFYSEEEFETGKKGVQVVITPGGIADYQGAQILPKMSGLRESIVITQSVDYQQFANSGLLADITDVVKADLSEYGDVDEEGNGLTIEGKLDDRLADFLCRDGKYYALPYYEAFYGIFYDVDLFENPNNLFYFAEGKSAEGIDMTADDFDLSSLFIQSPDAPRSYGPDGKTGVIDGVDYSADDGLPATYADFFALTLYMYTNSVTPMIWNGKLYYLTDFLVGMYANEEGYEQAALNLTFNGHAKTLVSGIDDNGDIISTYEEDITPENGNLLATQAGKYNVLKFWNKLVTDDKNYESARSFNGNFTHTDAQDTFLLSRISSEIKDVGMIVEASWLQAEASQTMSDHAIKYGSQYSRDNRRIAIMPFPWSSSDKVGQKQTALAT